MNKNVFRVTCAVLGLTVTTLVALHDTGHRQHVKPHRIICVFIDDSPGFGHIDQAAHITIELASKLEPSDRLIVYGYGSTVELLWDGPPPSDLDRLSSKRSCADFCGSNHLARRTRPLSWYCKKASLLNSPQIVWLTDGDNDFANDDPLLRTVGHKLSASPKRHQYGAFGVSCGNSTTIQDWFAGNCTVSTDPNPDVNQVVKDFKTPR